MGEILGIVVISDAVDRFVVDGYRSFGEVHPTVVLLFDRWVYDTELDKTFFGSDKCKSCRESREGMLGSFVGYMFCCGFQVAF